MNIASLTSATPTGAHKSPIKPSGSAAQNTGTPCTCRQTDKTGLSPEASQGGQGQEAIAELLKALMAALSGGQGQEPQGGGGAGGGEPQGGVAGLGESPSGASAGTSASPPGNAVSSPLSASSAQGPSQAQGSSDTPLAGDGSSKYDALIQEAAKKYGLDPNLLKSVIKQESGFNASAKSSAGAQGLMQLMPGTAKELGVSDPMDPAQSIDGGARYLAQQLKTFNGDVDKALAAYNAGPGNVKKHNGVPPFAETQKYVKNITADYANRTALARNSTTNSNSGLA